MAFHKLFVLVALQLTFVAYSVHSQISFPTSCGSLVPSCNSGIKSVSQFVIPAVIKPLIQPEYAAAPAVPEYGYPGPYGGVPIVVDDDDDFSHHWLYWLILLLSRRGGFGGWGNGCNNGGWGNGCNNGGCGCGGCCNNCNGGYNCGCNNCCCCGCNGCCRNCYGNGYGNGNNNNGPTNFLPYPFPFLPPSFPGYPPFDPYTEGPGNEVSLIIKTDQCPPPPPAS